MKHPILSILSVLILLFCLVQPVAAQQPFRIDSLPSDGLLLNKSWRWHPGDDPAWASPTLDDARWDTIRPTRSISRLPTFDKAQQGWFRLRFRLDSAVAEQAISAEINQVGASEVYLDGRLFLHLGTVGPDYAHQIGYTPIVSDIYLLPRLPAGRHTLAVRLSQHRPPWYMPKLVFISSPVFSLRLFPAAEHSERLIGQVYIQTLGNYLLIGIFMMLGTIHFMYYRYRRKRVNLIFGLTLLFGTLAVVLIETVGLASTSAVSEWLFLNQGLFVNGFMFMLLVTFYVYLAQPPSWPLGAIALLLLLVRILMHFTTAYTVSGILSTLSIIALFADGIRVSIRALRLQQPNARFIRNSIIVMLVILVGGGLFSWTLSSQYPEYGSYAYSVTNMLFFLTLPISFAIILAREYAQTNQSLEERLAEVNKLSGEKEIMLSQQNETLERQVTERTAELTQSLAELKATQDQLIQKEKMASLGELTAGIAHEIQNPLNFVTNFSEVSTELVGELKEELARGETDEARAIADDLTQNLQKITHHGQRASSIVKGMLEHSRTSTGERQLTNLNALADEYLRLAYHGLRARDSTFNCALVTNFDPALAPVHVVGQDIGRVLLNLFTNAFYAVSEKRKLAPDGYQPRVSVSTNHTSAGVEIRVSDNGTGMPDTVKAKIFQPFFTTKPTGEGTGLGLSLSYDIITKGHGGMLTVESKEGQGTEFLIRLPNLS